MQFFVLLILVLNGLICTSCANNEPPKTVAIFTYRVSGATPWDPDSIKSGITGSEEAIIYISQKLADLGYKVTVFNNPPVGSVHSLTEANPRFVNLDYNDDTIYDIAISWRMPTVAEQLKKRAQTVYFWPHDTSYGRVSEQQVNGFDDVLWLSQWQRDQWISENPLWTKFTKIFGNGINPEQFSPVTQRENPYSCIYGSNYARGLELMLDIWPAIKRQYPKATLDIYYGWQHWGLLSPQQESKMRVQLSMLSSMGVTDHGLVSHEELNKAYARSSFWTYPCIAPETFCITALRAQLSGAMPVIIEGSALKETVRAGYICKTPSEYLNTLRQAMSDAEKIQLSDRKKLGEFVLQEYTWKAVATKWKELFDSNLAAKKQEISAAAVP